MLDSGEDNNFKQVSPTNHHHHHHERRKVVPSEHIPKGYLPIKVGHGEEQQKFVVPLMYLNHPLFSQLLKEAEEEYGFDHRGTLTIPCRVEEFRYVQDHIDREKYPQEHHHRHHVMNCFRPSCQQDHKPSCQQDHK